MSDNKPKAFSGIKETWANPKARKGILLTGAVVGVVLAVTGMSMKGNGNSAPGVQSGASLAAPPVVKPDVTAKVSPQYQEMAAKRDDERAKTAAKTDLDMALPQVATLGQVQDTSKPTSGQSGMGLPPQLHNVPQAPAQAAPQNQQVAQLNNQSEMQARAQAEQMIRSNPAYNVAGAFMTSAAQSINSARTTPFGIIAAPNSGKNGPGGAGGQGAGQGGAGGAGAGSTALPPTPANVMIGAGEALYATMDTAINSDYSGPVVATVRQGKFAGSRIIGTKSLEYDAVVLKFNVISLPTGGPAIPVQAYAINLGDISKFGTTGLQGNVDYHVMQRYVLPAILAFGQTYGYAASISGNSTTTTGTSTTQSTNPLSNQDRALVALGGALGPIAADLQKQAQRPITIKMDANTEIGILFTTDVTDKAQQAAIDQAAKGVNAGLQTIGAPAGGTGAVTPATNAPARIGSYGLTGTVAPTGMQTVPNSTTPSTFTAPYAPATPVYGAK
jgi:intracellular multiplication protein IcmE